MMARTIVYGILVGVIATVIGFFVGGCSYGVLSGLSGSIDFIFALLILIPIFVFFTWLLSVPLGGLSHLNPAVYFGVCLTAALVFMIIGVCGGFSKGQENSNMIAAMACHQGLLFIIIPKINSESQDYLVTETTYYDGWEVSRREYIETRYLSGSLVKLVSVFLLSALFGYLAFIGWSLLVFAIEGGFCLFKFIQSLHAML